MDEYMPLCKHGHVKTRELWFKRKSGYWECRECNRIKGRKYKAKWTPEERAVRNGRDIAQKLARRTAIINEYGHACAWCGEDEYIFLTLDHVNDDGADHRRELGAGHNNILTYIEENNYPDSIQLLCWNCNATKQYHGEEKVKEAIEQRTKQRDNEPSGDAGGGAGLSELANPTSSPYIYRYRNDRIEMVRAQVRTSHSVRGRAKWLGLKR